MAWERIGSIDPRKLVDARLQLHWAAQAAAGVGRTLNTPRGDDSHTSFVWCEPVGALLQEPVNGTTVGVRIRDLTLLIAGSTNKELALRGKTLEDAFLFLEEHFGRMLRRPSIELPDHGVAHGAPFDVDDEELAELARYYANAASAIEQVARSHSNTNVVRCWPHHFDIAALLTLSGEGEHARTIGVGFSPGDDAYAEPYFYVTPWPYPEASKLGKLRIGRWNTSGWTGAILRASVLGDRQEATLQTFHEDAIARSRDALTSD
jgi:hypothetical protein